MIVGNRTRFAIEAYPLVGEGKWISGHFRFWVGGESVGDFDDYANLAGCANWLSDFAQRPRQRYEPLLERLPTAEVLRLVWDVNMQKSRSEFGADDVELEDASSRFYISHLGMSSFDRFDVILIFTSAGDERLLWRDGRNGRLGEARLRKGEMEEVALEASKAIYAELEVFNEP